MTHPERKAVSDEREKGLAIRLLGASDWYQSGHMEYVSLQQMSNAWLAVVAVLDEVHPGWDDATGTGIENATAVLRADAEKDETIRRLREALRNLRDCCLETSDHGEAMKGATIALAATASPATDTKDTK